MNQGQFFFFTVLWRDWKSGQLNLLIASLILAIATVSSISLFTSRINNTIFNEAAEFIAADAKVKGSQVIPQDWIEHSRMLDLKHATFTTFGSMAFSRDNMILTQVKAVSDGYPLKGALTVSKEMFGDAENKTQGPQPGEAWLAARVIDALKIKSGDTISIGEADFTVTAVVIREPDSGQSMFGLSPRVMIHADDVAKTKAIQLGSRIDYNLLLAGEDSNIADFKSWVDTKLGAHYRWLDAKSGNRGISSALTKAEQFLLLTGCLSVLLTGVAIALAARRYASKQKNAVALYKTFGNTPNTIARLYVVSLVCIGIVSLIAGSVLGWSLHWGIIIGLGNLMPANLAAPSWSAYSTGGIAGFVALWAFAAPPILALRGIPPASILRDHDTEIFSTKLGTVIGVVAMVLLMLIYSQDLKLTLLVSAAASLCFILVGLFSAALIWSTKRFGKKLNYVWRIGFANLQRHQRFNTLQIVVFAILFMLLFILFSVRTNLIDQWQKQIPENTPNHFAFNIFTDQIDPIKNFFQENSIQHAPFYPMTRGRLIKVNDTPVAEIVELGKRENRMNYQRELNLTQSPLLGKDNEIEAGEWWSTHTEKETEELLVSAEKDYAEGLDIKVGDKLTFSVAGQTVIAKVASIRSVQWDSMNPNFFMIFNREFLSSMGANWVTSFYLSPQEKPLMNQLSRKYPSISFIEFDQQLKQAQSIISKVSTAIEFILLLMISAGVLVLITSIQATLDTRVQESAIYRALGANKKLLRSTLLIEFTALGFLAGLLAVVGSELCLYFLQTNVFELNYQAQFSLWFAGPILSSFLIGFIGWSSTRRVINTPPLITLRENT